MNDETASGPPASESRSSTPSGVDGPSQTSGSNSGGPSNLQSPSPATAHTSTRIAPPRTQRRKGDEAYDRSQLGDIERELLKQRLWAGRLALVAAALLIVVALALAYSLLSGAIAITDYTLASFSTVGILQSLPSENVEALTTVTTYHLVAKGLITTAYIGFIAVLIQTAKSLIQSVGTADETKSDEPPKEAESNPAFAGASTAVETAKSLRNL